MKDGQLIVVDGVQRLAEINLEFADERCEAEVALRGHGILHRMTYGKA